VKNVLIINQSAELYGADKALLELLENYPDGYRPIVVLHEKGLLTKKLAYLNVQIIETSVIKVKRGILKLSFFLKLPFEIIQSFRTIKKELKDNKIDFVHSNATSVFIGAFYSFFYRKKHIWHVHEIIESPKRIALLYPKIVYLLSDIVIFNSNATANHFITIYPKIKAKSKIIYNGQQRKLEVSCPEKINLIRKNVFKVKNENFIVVGLVGRISRLKGHSILLKAFDLLHKKHDNIHLVFIGSSPKGQEFFTESLENKIKKLELTNCTIVPFEENIWPIYDSLDIVVVPSTEPESFGLVATEAMLSKKPVIATNLGGLKEVVEDGKTGYLFENKNIEELSNKLELLINDKSLRVKMGEKGFERVNNNFSAEKYVRSFEKEYSTLISSTK
jgi:glycosyltransferase involved in cell wall biosynthesis